MSQEMAWVMKMSRRDSKVNGVVVVVVVGNAVIRQT